jgi:hypothetical protein
MALSLLVTMPPNPEASEADKRSLSAASLDLEVDQWLPPMLPPVSEAVDSKHDVDTDKPYSAFTSRDKCLVVSLASFAALFRQVGTLYMLTDAHSLGSHIAPSLRTYIFLQSLSSQEIFTKA